MPIIRCTCGADLTLHDHSRGRKYRCPKCGVLLRVEHRRSRDVPSRARTQEEPAPALGAGVDHGGASGAPPPAKRSTPKPNGNTPPASTSATPSGSSRPPATRATSSSTARNPSSMPNAPARSRKRSARSNTPRSKTSRSPSPSTRRATSSTSPSASPGPSKTLQTSRSSSPCRGSGSRA